MTIHVVTLIVVDHVNDQNNGAPHGLKEHIPAIPSQIVNVGQQTRFIPNKLLQSGLKGGSLFHNSGRQNQRGDEQWQSICTRMRAGRFW